MIKSKKGNLYFLFFIFYSISGLSQEMDIKNSRHLSTHLCDSIFICPGIKSVVINNLKCPLTRIKIFKIQSDLKIIQYYQPINGNVVISDLERGSYYFELEFLTQDSSPICSTNSFFHINLINDGFDQCQLLDSIFNRLYDFFPLEQKYSTIRLFDLANKFQSCENYKYKNWYIKYFNELTYDTNTGRSKDFIIISDSTINNVRRITFFYEQSHCEKDVKNSVGGYIEVQMTTENVKISEFSVYYID